jgi:hypothetical protein
MFIWVDALCIDQGCQSERETQVANMGRIYSGASVVLVWLGQHDENSRTLMRHLQVHGVDAFNRPSPGLQPAVYGILSRSYWTRMCILQEIYLAKDLIAGCGDFFTPWDSLRRLLNMSSHTTDEEDITTSKAWPIIRQRLNRGGEGARILKRRLDKKILDFGDRNCSDIRDRVYSLLGISWTNSVLSVDYSINKDELFVSVVGSIDWGNAAWRDFEETKHFEEFINHLRQHLGVDIMSIRARESVEAIRRQMYFDAKSFASQP